MLPKVAKIAFGVVTFGPQNVILSKLIEKVEGIFWMAKNFCSLLSHLSSNLIDYSVCEQN